VLSHEMLELQPRARVTGDLRYELLKMYSSAQVGGELKPIKSNTDKAVLKLAASNDI